MCELNNRCNRNGREEAIQLIERGAAKVCEGLCKIKRGCICAGICECEKGLAKIMAGLRILKHEDRSESNCDCR